MFYIPFAYYYVVRLGTLPKLLSWMLIYLMPTAFYSAVGYSGPWPLFALSYLLVLLATFSLYECGYIINDAVSIRREEQPAIRLYDRNLSHFARWQACILGARLLYALTALLCLYLLCRDTAVICHIGLALLAMCLLFALYNRCRSRNNVWLYPLLVCSRYLPFLLLFPHPGTIYLLLFLSFPLLNALERFSMPRYRWPLMRTLIPDEPSKTRFRVAYYILLVLITTPLILLTEHSWEWLLPIYILCAYRIALALWLRTHHPDNYLNG